MYIGGIVRVVAWLAVGLIGGCAVGVAEVADCYIGTVWVVFITLVA